MAVNSCHIAHALRHKWPEAIRSLTEVNNRFFTTGVAELDAFFPSGRGLPYGQLIEITGGVSSGKTSLLLCLLSATPHTAAYIDFSNSFFPDAISPTINGGPRDFSRLLVIKPTSSSIINGGPPKNRDDSTNSRSGCLQPDKMNPQLKSGLRSGELLLRDRHANIIVFDLANWRQPLPIGLLHRLRLKTVRAKGLVIFLTQSSDIIPASMTSLRLAVERSDDQELPFLVTVTKSRLCAEGLQVQVRL